MNQFFSIVLLIIIWLLSFVEPSGLGQMMHLTDKANWAILITSILFLLLKPQQHLPISRTLFLTTIIFIAIIPYLVCGKVEGFTYLVAFLTTYVSSQCLITEKVVKYSSIIIAVLGLVVLYIYTKGNILSGWNDNAISMVGLFSFLYFSIYLISLKGSKSFWIWNIVTLIYLELLFMTDCRSGMLFAIVAVVGIIFNKTSRNILSKRLYQRIILNAPLLLAIIVIAVAAMPIFERLNMWSLENYDKGIFDGRDTLWQYAFDRLTESNYLGTGKFIINYHNSGVAAISVFGILGYICWITLFGKFWSFLKPYLQDGIVFGALLAFVIIYLQQALDLGLISPTPNLLPYAILGGGIGRVRYIKKHA